MSLCFFYSFSMYGITKLQNCKNNTVGIEATIVHNKHRNEMESNRMEMDWQIFCRQQKYSLSPNQKAKKAAKNSQHNIITS